MMRALTFPALVGLGLVLSSLRAAPSVEPLDLIQGELVPIIAKPSERGRPTPRDRAGEDRIWLAAHVNGQPVRLIFDTGATASFLFRSAAERINLRFTDIPSDLKPGPGLVAAGMSEECTLSLRDSSHRVRFRIIDGPPFRGVTVDGALAWPDLSENVFRFWGAEQKVEILTEVPQEAAAWLKCELQPSKGKLALRIPSKEKLRGLILIDTGSSYGVQLGAERWRQWSHGRRDVPATLTAYWTPADGLLVRKELWAQRLTFGDLTISEVPVQQCSPGQEQTEHHEATFDLYALGRLDLIVDGKNGCAYVRPSQHSPLPYEHNRMGAVFVPGGPRGEDLVARVLDTSPAYAAGIRHGDILLRIYDLGVTNLQTDARVLPLSRFWCRPVGTRLQLHFRRNGQTLQANVELSEILSPELVGERAKATQRERQDPVSADAGE